MRRRSGRRGAARTLYVIRFTTEASDDLRAFRRFDQSKIVDGVEAQLQQEPAVETRNRKRLRPNELAEWELRVGRFRVFYDVAERARVVTIAAVGVKDGNRLFIHGEPYEL